MLLTTLLDVPGGELGHSTVLHLGQLGVDAARPVKLDANLAGGPIAVLAEQGKRTAGGVCVAVGGERLGVCGWLDRADLEGANADGALIAASSAPELSVN